MKCLKNKLKVFVATVSDHYYYISICVALFREFKKVVKIHIWTRNNQQSFIFLWFLVFGEN